MSEGDRERSRSPAIRTTSLWRLALSVAAVVALVAATVALPLRTSRTTGPVPDRVAETPDPLSTHGVRVIPEQGARWEWREGREIRLDSGRLYLDVEPSPSPLRITHPKGLVTVLGTRLMVDAGGAGIRVAVGSGAATLANDAGSVSLGPGEAGIAREGQEPVKEDARRFSFLASFISESLDADAGQGSEDEGGFAYGVARIPGPGGMACDLEVVRYHIDVHIEDGMARTTIDQIFYNPNWSRVEGTFLFPLPPDASISRLAMYVDGRLMEGSMAERRRAAQVYEGIVRRMQDPAILEWMEGSTFRLRIFPFEPHSERRIILSYQQSLESLYELDRYRFPILRPSGSWGEFSIRVLIKGGGADGWEVATPTYAFEKVAPAAAGDAEFSYEEKMARPARDVIVEIRRPRRPALDYASHEGDDGRMICATATPRISGDVYRGRRRALLVIDQSGNVSESERRALVALAKGVVEALDSSDWINVITYNTEACVWFPNQADFEIQMKGILASWIPDHLKRGFVGAGDLSAALRTARDLLREPKDGDVIFYFGDGIDTWSGLDPEKLVAILPEKVPFLAIPVTRSFHRPLLDALARRSGGRVIPVSPDDRIAWRAFDLVSALRTPGWDEVSFQFLDADERPMEGDFHVDRSDLRDGESIQIAGRIGERWPRSLVLNGEKIDLGERRTGCGWIPRLWAKLRIEALERETGAEHRQEIVRLGKQYYVMTPYTSLLVLENEEMYEQYKIDRGRRDHWALYPAPKEWRGRVKDERRDDDPFASSRSGFPWALWGGIWQDLSTDTREMLRWMESFEMLDGPPADWWNTSFLEEDRAGAQRTPGQPTEEEEEESAEIRAIKRVIATQRISVDFDKKPLADVVDFIRKASTINIAVDSDVDAAQITVELQLERALLRDALDLIMDHTGLRYTFREGTLLITVPEKARGPQVFRIYPVTDILNRIRNFPGPRLDIRSPDEEDVAPDFEFRIADWDDDVIPPEELIDFIRESTGGDEAWDEDTALEHHRGQLLIEGPIELHRRVLEVLRELRKDSPRFPRDPLGIRPEEARGYELDGLWPPLWTWSRWTKISPDGASPLLERFLPKGIDLAVSFGGRRAILFSGGERLLESDGRIVCLRNDAYAVFDPLFKRVLRGYRAPGLAWAELPWFLVPLEVLIGGAHVDERRDGDSTIIRIDAGGPTIVEFAFRERRPVEVRLILREGQAIQRVLYDAWEAIEGRSLPVHGMLVGPDKTALDEMTYRYGLPGEQDREWLRRLRPTGNDETVGPAADADLRRALYLHRTGDRAKLRSLLWVLETDGAADDAIRKVAGLDAIRWGSEPAIAAPSLAADLPAVRRWLPPKRTEVEVGLRHSLQRGDLSTFARLMRGGSRREERIPVLEGLREDAPPSLRGTVDLWIGDIAMRRGLKLKAYVAFFRAMQGMPPAATVGIHDCLSALALSLNEVTTAIEHAERALEILAAAKSPLPRSQRHARLAEIAETNPEILKRRGPAILEAWAQADPRDPEPFRRLAMIHREAGRTAEAIRYASQSVEVSPTPENYFELAKELERVGDPARAAICREIGARLKK